MEHERALVISHRRNWNQECWSDLPTQAVRDHTGWLSLFRVLYKIPWAGCLINNKRFISHGSRDHESEIRAPSMMGWGPFWFTTDIFLWHPHNVDKGRESSVGPLPLGHISHSWGLHPHDLITLKVPPRNAIITLGSKIPTYEFGEDTDTQVIARDRALSPDT